MKRFVAAEVKLYEKLDCRAQGEDWNKTVEALKRMEVGLSKSYRDQVKKVVTQTKISLDWMRNSLFRVNLAYLREMIFTSQRGLPLVNPMDENGGGARGAAAKARR